jgi:hypothetical protein
MTEQDPNQPFQPEAPNQGNYYTPPGPDIGMGVDQKPTPAKKAPFFGMGCLGFGLLGCLGTFVVFVVLFFFGMNWFVTNFFSKKPLDIPKAYLSYQEEQSLVKKMKVFKESSDKKDGKPISLQLTMNEFNYQMQNSGKQEVGSVYLKASDDGSNLTEITMSLPMDNNNKQAPLYLNMYLKGKFAIEDYSFNINLSNAKVGNLETVDKKYLDQISRDLEVKIPNAAQYRQLPIKVKNLKIDKNIITIEMIVKSAEEIVPVETKSGST